MSPEDRRCTKALLRMSTCPCHMKNRSQREHQHTFPLHSYHIQIERCFEPCQPDNLGKTIEDDCYDSHRCRRCIFLYRTMNKSWRLKHSTCPIHRQDNSLGRLCMYQPRKSRNRSCCCLKSFLQRSSGKMSLHHWSISLHHNCSMRCSIHTCLQCRKYSWRKYCSNIYHLRN